MDICYSGDHIAEDHIHTNMTNVAPSNHDRSTALERSGMDYWFVCVGGGGGGGGA